MALSLTVRSMIPDYDYICYNKLCLKIYCNAYSVFILICNDDNMFCDSLNLFVISVDRSLKVNFKLLVWRPR